jgi:hypothetical protein
MVSYINRKAFVPAISGVNKHSIMVKNVSQPSIKHIIFLNIIIYEFLSLYNGKETCSTLRLSKILIILLLLLIK